MAGSSGSFPFSLVSQPFVALQTPGIYADATFFQFVQFQSKIYVESLINALMEFSNAKTRMIANYNGWLSPYSVHCEG